VFFADQRSKRLLSFLMAAFFLILQTSMLLIPARAPYPAMSSSEVSSYLLMVDLSNDSVYAAVAQNRSRRSASSNSYMDFAEYGVFPRETAALSDKNSETYIYPSAAKIFAFVPAMRFNVVSRK
jgi:hypothetical protein